MGSTANFNVNAAEIVKFTNKLEKLSNTAFPNVVRKTLNDTAMHVKKLTLPKSAAKTFTIRQASFFKAKSAVKFAKGREVSSMASAVGMMDRGLKGGNSHAVKNLEKHEHGGTIKGVALLPTESARVGNSRTGKVRAKNRIGDNRRIVRPTGKSKGEFLSAAREAGVGGLVFGTTSPTVFKVRKLKKGAIKVTPVYTVEKGRQLRAKPTGFARLAALQSQKTMEQTFAKLAVKRFNRVLK
tara:strand:- start:2151 stop:2870 length:720 start_codon:yes stop_codon:yes gene_type:complete